MRQKAQQQASLKSQMTRRATMWDNVVKRPPESRPIIEEGDDENHEEMIQEQTRKLERFLTIDNNTIAKR